MARVIQFGCSTHKNQFIGLMIRELNIVMPVNLNIVWLYVMNIVSLIYLLEGFFNKDALRPVITWIIRYCCH